jgi:hypothetical protein
MVADVSLADKGHQGSFGCSSAPAWPILPLSSVNYICICNSIHGHYTYNIYPVRAPTCPNNSWCIQSTVSLALEQINHNHDPPPLTKLHNKSTPAWALPDQQGQSKTQSNLCILSCSSMYRCCYQFHPISFSAVLDRSRSSLSNSICCSQSLQSPFVRLLLSRKCSS